MTLSSQHRPSRRVRTMIWLTYWVMLFILTHMPVVRGVTLPQFSDKVIHFIMFLLLVLLGGWRYRAKANATRRGILIWTTIFIAYAGFDEWLQQFVRRSTSIYDFWADLTGIVVATVALLAWYRPRAISDLPPGG